MTYLYLILIPCSEGDEFTERLGPSRYSTTLSPIKGYWQVPIPARAKEKVTFATPVHGPLFCLKQELGNLFSVHRILDHILKPDQA